MSEVKVKEKNSVVKNVIIILLVLVTLSLTGYIVYTDFIKVKENDQTDCVDYVLDDDGSENNKEVSGELKEELLSIAGISLDVESELYGGDLQSVFLDNSGVINDFSDYSKRIIVYAYALKNNLLETFGADYYNVLPMCQYGSGTCLAIKEDNYNTIVEKYGISEKGDQLYSMDSSVGDYLTKYNDYYIFSFGGWAAEATLKHDEVTVKYVGNSIVITDKVSIKISNKADDTKVITYTFNKNDDGYYLYSVYNRAI